MYYSITAGLTRYNSTVTNTSPSSQPTKPNNATTLHLPTNLQHSDYASNKVPVVIGSTNFGDQQFRNPNSLIQPRSSHSHPVNCQNNEINQPSVSSSISTPSSAAIILKQPDHVQLVQSKTMSSPSTISNVTDGSNRTSSNVFSYNSSSTAGSKPPSVNYDGNTVTHDLQQQLHNLKLNNSTTTQQLQDITQKGITG